jgi:hypothetical protein
MKRDMDLVRRILLFVQEGSPNSSIDGYSDGAVKYHRALVIEAGLAEGTVMSNNITPTEVPAAVALRKLTWEGHDFIEAIESDGNWVKVKAFLAEAGKQLTVETVKFAAKQLFGVVGT